MPEEITPQSVSPLAPVAELIERVFNRFSRLFSTLFPWMVLFCLGGFATVLYGYAGAFWLQITLGITGIIVVLFSYLAVIRIIADVEKEPRDIVGTVKTVLSLFFPALWLMILQGFIFLGGSVLVVPLVIFWIFLAVMFFVFMVENRRGISALTRSWAYIAGRWWATLWRIVVLVFLVMVAMVIVGIVLGLGFGTAGSNASPSVGMVLINQLISAFLVVPWSLCYLFELYQDLRASKPVPAQADEKTARLWLVIFLTIGIILALILIFGAVTHTAAHGFGGLRYR